MPTQKVNIEHNYGPENFKIAKPNSEFRMKARFEMDVPVEHDETGRRVNFFKYVAPIIDEFCSQTQFNLECGRLNRLGGTQKCAEDSDVELYERMSSPIIKERLHHNATLVQMKQEKWEAERNAECWEWFRMPWREFRLLPSSEQIALRKQHGIVWRGGKWTKDEVQKELI